MTAPLPPPGWYPDPGGANTQRYFDGTKRTDQLAPFRNDPVARAWLWSGVRRRSGPRHRPQDGAIRADVAVALARLSAFASAGVISPADVVRAEPQPLSRLE